MGQLARVVDRAIKKEVSVQLNGIIPQIQQQSKASSLSGKAEVIEINDDGTANVKISGQIINNVQLAGRPAGPGTIGILQAGSRFVN
jgi:hypothetical protein